MPDPRVADDDRADHVSAPVTTLSTPGGSARTRCLSVCTDDSGVVGGGFTITVLPDISAAGRDAARIASGQLNG